MLGVLWQAGNPLTVREVLDAVNDGRRPPLAYTTVMTVLTRLAERDALHRTKVGKGFRYAPVAADRAGLAVHRVLNDFGDAAVAHFVDHVKADDKLLAALHRLLDADRPSAGSAVDPQSEDSR